MKVINFLSGPGAGKSTLCAGLFYEMKKSGLNVEYVHEWAKELTWDERHKCLTDQISILGHQNNMIRRLSGKVDWVVTDSAIILGLMYVPNNYYSNFEPLILEVFNLYDNFNIYVDRPSTYSEIGRIQNLDQAKEIDNNVLNLLNKHKINYTRVSCQIEPKDLLKKILQ
jgi:tRNA uridine 5-carbamoylmethylation protein Kti12